MTNGEKFKEVFGVSQVDEGELYAYAWLSNHNAAEFSIDWWSANYSEIPTGSTDCISRQAVIDLMMQKWGENFSGDDAMQESIDAIRVMPSVTPQEPKWISVKDRLPQRGEYGDVLVTFIPTAGTLWATVMIARYSDLMGIAKPCFHIGEVGKRSFEDITSQVTAWMPLPKPYEPQESEDKE